jgi:DNA-binding transcriptional MerR regulator
MPEILYSTHDCAKLLGIDEHRITYAQRKGSLPEPTFFVAGKRIYTADDLADIATYFGLTLPNCGESAKSNRRQSISRKEARE